MPDASEFPVRHLLYRRRPGDDGRVGLRRDDGWSGIGGDRSTGSNFVISSNCSSPDDETITV